MRSVVAMVVVCGALFTQVACVAQGVLLDDDGERLFDTDTDTGDVDTTDIDTDVDTDADTEPDTEPAPFVWAGERNFTFYTWFGECEDTLIETGIEVTNDPDAQDAAAACPQCRRLFWVEMDKDSLCEGNNFRGFPVASPVLRGIEFPGGSDHVLYSIGQRDNGSWVAFELASGELAGDTYEYEYDGSVSNVEYDVEGEYVLQ